MAQALSTLVEQQPGFLGVESARNNDGLNSAHQIAQQKGREIWYGSYTAWNCKVERDYSF